MSKITVVEQRDVERAYGFDGCDAIIEHPVHGRLLITDGYGEVQGAGCVRWRHGIAIKLRPTDDFDALEAEWNDWTSTLSAACNGCDATRPVLGWSGHAIRAVARAAGLGG